MYKFINEYGKYIRIYEIDRYISGLDISTFCNKLKELKIKTISVYVSTEKHLIPTSGFVINSEKKVLTLEDCLNSLLMLNRLSE